MKIKKMHSVCGELTIPGDKSISHRAVMLGALADGTTHISGFLNGADCLSTIDCFRNMGINIEINGNDITVHGKGLTVFKNLKKCFIPETAAQPHVCCAEYCQVSHLTVQ